MQNLIDPNPLSNRGGERGIKSYFKNAAVPLNG